MLFLDGFLRNSFFKIVMSGRLSGGCPAGIWHWASSEVYLLVNLFFKVICYLYSSMDCFHIW